MIQITPADIGYGGGHEIRLNGSLIGYRPYDGADWQKVSDEVTDALGGLLREKLGWLAVLPEDDEEGL